MAVFKQPKKWLPAPFVILRTVLAVTAFMAGASFCFANSTIHTAPTFYYLNQLPIPWPVYGVVLLIGAGCLFVPRVRPIGYLLGAIVYSFFAVLTWAAVIGAFHLHVFVFNHIHYPHNGGASFFAAGNITTIAVLYWSALRAATYAQVDPDRTPW